MRLFTDSYPRLPLASPFITEEETQNPSGEEEFGFETPFWRRRPREAAAIIRALQFIPSHSNCDGQGGREGGREGEGLRRDGRADGAPSFGLGQKEGRKERQLMLCNEARRRWDADQ